MLQCSLTTKIETNEILKKNQILKESEKIENLQQNFWTAVKMREQIESEVEVKADSEQQKSGKQGPLPTHETENCRSKE